MAFTIESTFDGRALFEEPCIVGAATVTTGELVALTAGAGLPTATLSGIATVPHGIITTGGVTGATGAFIRIMPGDILKAPAMAADGTTALATAENTALIALVGTQAMKISATGTNFDGVTTSGGKLELVSFDSVNEIVRVRVPIVS